MEVDPAAAARRLMGGLPLEVVLEGESLEVLPEEVEVRYEAREGFAAVAEGPLLAALDTVITPDLRLEGLMREFLRRVQELRKQSELEVSDRIEVEYRASTGLQEAIEAHRSYIMAEALADRLESVEEPGGEAQAGHEFEGETLLVALSLSGG